MAAPESKPVHAGQVTVQAFADRQAAAPGGTFDLAISFKIQKDWHVYWASPGGLTGIPTQVIWTGPGGYRFDRCQFPVPRAKFDKILNETSFILEGEPALLTTVHVPDSATPRKDAIFKAKISWLVCKETCIPGDAEVSISLPIVARGKESPANAKFFTAARRALPEPLDQARHVKLSFQTDKKSVKPGDKFAATVAADIAPHHHMQSNKPLEPELIPAVVFVEHTDGMDIGEVAYPAGEVRQDKVLGKLSEYAGKISLSIPITVADDADKSPRGIRGVFQYQVCNDTGTCFPPQRIAFAIPVQMEGGPAPITASAVSPPPVKPSASADSGVHAVKPQASGPKPSAAPAPSSGANQNILQRLEMYLLSFGYKGAILVALIGGFLLNLMPCVLPVISLKILSFVRQAHEHRARVFWLGMTYAAGIMVFFGAIALLYLYTNRQFSWGEQFQRPHVVLGLAAIVTAFALSLFGVWTVFTPRVINKLGERAEGEGFSHAFATGLLATFLGTACTAPFLSAAIGAASKFSPAQGALIFLAVGVGMAFPFIVLAANPAWLRFVPRAGPWMLSFEYFMGFLLLGTVVWLINPLRNQIGGEGLLLSLIFLLAVAMAAWTKGKIQFNDTARRKLAYYVLSLLVLAIGWMLPFRWWTTIDDLRAQENETQHLIAEAQRARLLIGGYNLDWSHGIPWQRYTRDHALSDVRSGYTVFIDYTADWCANCKTMLKTVIERDEVVRVMQELKVIPYTADYTNPVPEIKEDLARFNRAGVPMFLVYRPKNPDRPEVLPEAYPPSTLVEALRRAGPSQVAVAKAPWVSTPSP